VSTLKALNDAVGQTKFDDVALLIHRQIKSGVDPDDLARAIEANVFATLMSFLYFTTRETRRPVAEAMLENIRTAIVNHRAVRADA
jgi:hypothetical protein